MSYQKYGNSSNSNDGRNGGRGRDSVSNNHTSQRSHGDRNYNCNGNTGRSSPDVGGNNPDLSGNRQDTSNWKVYRLNLVLDSKLS